MISKLWLQIDLNKWCRKAGPSTMIRRKNPVGRSIALLLLVGGLLAGCGEKNFEPRIAPDYSLPLLDGSGHVVMSETKGDVVYVGFWASWCEPCRQELPYLAQLYKRHREEGFQVMAINVDEDLQAAKQFAAEYDLPFTVLRDADKEVAKRYRVPGYPTHFLVDRDGRIRFSGVGFNLNDVNAVSQEVATLIAEPVLNKKLNKTSD